jgi:hypothetical protein
MHRFRYAMPQADAALRPATTHIDRRPAFWFVRPHSIFMVKSNRLHPEGNAMTNMKDRQESFERKFALDEEQKFRAIARRNKLLGLWAAEKLGKSGGDADAYATEVVKADFEEVGDEDVFRKIRKDFDAAGVEQSDHQIRRTMEELLATAAEQVKNG